VVGARPDPLRPLPAAWRDGYPFARRVAEVGGGWRMHAVDDGDGPPVVMVHGNPSWSYYYRRLILELRATHRCVAPDHIGMGLSDKPDDGAYSYTLSRRVDDFAACLDALAVTGPLSLVVHDWGGMIALAWAVEHPDRVARVVILNTAAFPLPPGKRFPWPLALARTPIGALLVRGGNAFAWTATWAAMARGRMDADTADAFTWPYDSWADRIATLRFVEDIPLSPSDPAWAVVEATAAKLHLLADKPTLIAWGGRDFVFDHAFLAEWRRRLPRAQVHEFADAGHYVLEDAADEVVPLVARFIRAA